MKFASQNADAEITKKKYGEIEISIFLKIIH